MVTDDTPVDRLGLSTRTRNALVHEEVLTLAAIRFLTDAELLRLPGLGRKGLNECRLVAPAYKPQVSPPWIAIQRLIREEIRAAVAAAFESERERK